MNSKRVRQKLKCLSQVKTHVTFCGHVLHVSTACLQTLLRSVTSIKVRMVRTSEYIRLRLFSFFRANFKISTAIRELSRTDGIMGRHPKEIVLFCQKLGPNLSEIEVRTFVRLGPVRTKAKI